MDRKFAALVALGLLAAAGAAAAVLEPGYGMAVQDVGRRASNALAFDGDDRLLFAHDSAGNGYPDQIWAVTAPGQPATLFAQNFGSVAAILPGPPGITFVADNKIGPGIDGCVWRLDDANDDGDCLDPFEVRLYSPDGAIDHVADIARRADGVIFATDADGFGAGDLYILEDLNTDGDCADSGETRIWATGVESATGFLAGIVVRDDGTVVFLDSAGVLRAARDENGDGDAEDSGEVTVLVAGLAGGADLAESPGGDLYVAGSSYPAPHRIERVRPDLSVSVLAEFDGVTDLGWTGSLAFADPAAPFTPYSGPGGNVLYMAYTSPDWTTPDSFMVFTPSPPDVPALGPAGLALLAGLLGALLARRRRS